MMIKSKLTMIETKALAYEKLLIALVIYLLHLKNYLPSEAAHWTTNKLKLRLALQVLQYLQKKTENQLQHDSPSWMGSLSIRWNDLVS